MEVRLCYYGHSSFLWITPSRHRILIDPYRNPEAPRERWFLRPFPTVEADVLLVSHPHFDHCATERVLGKPTILRTPGTFIGGDLKVEALLDRHPVATEQSSIVETSSSS
ncbi:MAG: hypothetical protein AYL28_007270 [Candidatus Bathyarchaeota archaeon B23]|nr:MAG: hypothetical protein AYL28_007270 [Candidatus Bathyarchaeota archaeon B23]